MPFKRHLARPRAANFTLWPSPVRSDEHCQVSVAGRLRVGTKFGGIIAPLDTSVSFLSSEFIKRGTVLRSNSTVGKIVKRSEVPSLEVSPCEAKPKNVGENFAS